MELKEILAISGQPGLYKFVAQSSNGIIVESLADGKRSNVAATTKVSTLSEIALFTDNEDKPLSEVFENLYKLSGGKESISPKSTPEQMKAKFAEVLPEYDRDRVHVSDMKKVFAWYNVLVGAGMTDFSAKEEAQEAPAEAKEAGKEAVKKAPAAKKPAAGAGAKKTSAKESTAPKGGKQVSAVRKAQ